MSLDDRYDRAIAHAIGRLRIELPRHLTYHNLWHTLKDVIPAAVRLARLSNLSAAETQLVQVAAAYHDMGFLETHQENERIAARIAAETLPGYGFTAAEIETITGMILATRLPASPRRLGEAILADADLDVLGRDDFFERSRALRQELAYHGQTFTTYEWQQQQLLFLKQHQYFTPAARSLRQAGKEKHIAFFEELLRRDR